MSGCGHLMHYACFEHYFESIRRRHQMQIPRRQPERVPQHDVLTVEVAVVGHELRQPRPAGVLVDQVTRGVALLAVVPRHPQVLGRERGALVDHRGVVGQQQGLAWARLEDAAKRAGFDEVERLAEPHAAAIVEDTDDGTVLALDFGGGTFDVAVIEFAGVTVRRGTSLLLDDVSWEVEEDERWVVLGPNGAGKTTLLQVAAAQLHPTRGEVRVLGETMGAVDVFELRTRIGLTSAALAQRIGGGERVDGAQGRVGAGAERLQEGHGVPGQRGDGLLLEQVGAVDEGEFGAPGADVMMPASR